MRTGVTWSQGSFLQSRDLLTYLHTPPLPSLPDICCQTNVRVRTATSLWTPGVNGCELGARWARVGRARSPGRPGECRRRGRGGSSEGREEGARPGAPAEERGPAAVPGRARSRRRLPRRPPHHLKTDGNVGQSGDFIFFMNFLNSLFFLSHL